MIRTKVNICSPINKCCTTNILISVVFGLILQKNKIKLIGIFKSLAVSSINVETIIYKKIKVQLQKQKRRV